MLLPIIVVVGPTASGKTEIGLKLAEHIGGEIISADSMQIYRWMDIGTAKPTPAMRRQVPHHLIDIINPDQPYNAGRFVQDADTIIERLYRQKKPAIILGGTNLYLKSLVYGIIPVPGISPLIKREIKSILAADGVAGCYRLLTEKDPESAAKLHPNDISRVSRALEVFLETGKSIKACQAQHRFSQKRYRALFLGPNWTRETLYDRINRRVLDMVDEGLIEEAENLLWRGYSTDLPSMQSIGYKQAFAYLNDEIDMDDMIEDIQQKSRRYAKKQMTWNRNNKEIHWLDTNTVTEKTYRLVEDFLKSAEKSA